MNTRQGRPAKYVNDRNGRPVVGLSLHLASGRYYTSHFKPPVYFGRDLDVAIVRFRAWEDRQTGKVVQFHGLTPMPTPEDIAAAAAEGCVMNPRRDVNIFPTDVPEDAFWARVREEIIQNPARVAERVGIPEIGWLTEVRKPEPSLKLGEVLDAYLRTKKKLSTHWAGKTKLFWSEFTAAVGKQVLREVTAEDIERYHDMVWSTAKREGRSPTWVNHRLSAVRTVLRYSLKKGKDIEHVRRTLDLTEIFEREQRSGVDPRPISPDHFNKLLEVADTKWRAILLLGLNAVAYPKEIAELKKSELDLDRKELVTRRGKTGIIRAAMLWDRTVAAIKAYLDAEPHQSEYLFVSHTGDKYTSNHMGRNFRRRRELAELPEDVTMNQLRDGGYTAVIEAGFDLQVARLIAGHATGISDAYVRRRPTMVADACAAIEKYYFPAASR